MLLLTEKEKAHLALQNKFLYIVVGFPLKNPKVKRKNLTKLTLSSGPTMASTWLAVATTMSLTSGRCTATPSTPRARRCTPLPLIRLPSRPSPGVPGSRTCSPAVEAPPIDTSASGTATREPIWQRSTPSRRCALCCGRLTIKKSFPDTDSQTTKLLFGSIQR